MDANGYSLSDIAAATEGMNGSGNNWIWIIILFLFMFGNGGFGGTGRGNTATVEDLSQAFSFNDMADKLDGITNGLCSGFYEQNTTMLNGFNGLQKDILSQTNAINQNICDCKTAILDAISTNRMADMQNQINQLQLQQALGNVVRYPSATTWSAGTSPCFTNTALTCGCNNY